MDIEDSDDDQVVKEIPVHACTELFEKLYLFEFPCRLGDASYSTKNVISSRIKPKSGIVELDCALNTDDKFYDKHTGSSLCNSKPNSKDTSKLNSANKHRSDQLLDKITLQSQRNMMQKDISSYSVASLCEGKLCISSLHDSVSFLPTYEHIEQSKKSKGGAESLTSADSSSSSEDEDVDNVPAVQVTVKFSPRNQDKSKISHELSHQQYITKIAEEPWCETSYHNSNSSLALTKLEALSKTSSKVTSMLSLPEKEYLNILLPSETDELNEAEK